MSCFNDLTYKSYILVGGMPQALMEYLAEKDYNFVTAVQKNINDAYIADIAKYATPNETTRIMAAFNSIPSQLAKPNRKFQYKVIKLTGSNRFPCMLFFAFDFDQLIKIKQIHF